MISVPTMSIESMITSIISVMSIISIWMSIISVPPGFCIGISVSLRICFSITFFNSNNGFFGSSGFFGCRYSIRVGINRVSYNPSGLGTGYQSTSLIFAGVGHGYMDNWGCMINYRGHIWVAYSINPWFGSGYGGQGNHQQGLHLL